jgi:CMP/dCMP kinase
VTSTGDAGTARAGLVIAVDGPSGSGKSSAARGAARALGLRYLDTGAMYRALTWWMLRAGVDISDRATVAATAGRPAIEIGTDPDHRTVTVDGIDVTGAIRTRAVTNAVSAVSAVPEVRVRLAAMQREAIAAARAEGRGIVVEGRDIGTVVAPDAQVKIFLTASETIRAQRRAADLATDPAATAALTREELARRDLLDSTRAVSPLLKAADAVEIDTTSTSLDEVVARIVELAQQRTVSA